MWFRRCKNTLQKLIVIIFALEAFKGCEAISNANFNAQIRDYSVVEDNFNLTDVKTLQKQGLGLGRYANFAPTQNIVKFKDIPDTVTSGSSHSRGLLHHEHSGYGFDYEDPHYGHGYEFQPYESDHHDPHDYNHYDFHDAGHHHSPGHHHGYGHHHKHYDHGLATKALLWPIAGIALLGAAAALVSNPVLLQLGVVSGKRKRRHTDEMENIANDSIKKWSKVNAAHTTEGPNVSKHDVKKRMLRKDDFVKPVKNLGNRKRQVETVTNPTKFNEDRRFIPIPLIMKKT